MNNKLQFIIDEDNLQYGVMSRQQVIERYYYAYEQRYKCFIRGGKKHFRLSIIRDGIYTGDLSYNSLAKAKKARKALKFYSVVTMDNKCFQIWTLKSRAEDELRKLLCQ